MQFTTPEARLELMLLESKADDYCASDFEARFLNAGLPLEVTLRLRELWEKTCVVAGKVLRIGKIVLMELARFVDENPSLSIGVALGAGAGLLASFIPLLGPFLAPLCAALGIAIGAIQGARLDRVNAATNLTTSLPQEVIIVARKFFELFIAIFQAVSSDARTEK